MPKFRRSPLVLVMRKRYPVPNALPVLLVGPVMATPRTGIGTTRRLTALLLIGIFCAGCVERRLLIRTNPPGAMAYVDDYQVGLTPIGTSFTYYGTRKIRLVKDGYQPLTVYERINPPWYEIPPFDFFAENILRREIRDTRVLEYQLIPQPVSPPQQLLERAQSLRSRAATQPPLPAVGEPGVAPSAGPPVEGLGAFPQSQSVLNPPLPPSMPNSAP